MNGGLISSGRQWREALLAQKVLGGGTRGYRSHPQLNRFREHPNPLGAIASYLRFIYREAARRGYGFDRSRIGRGWTRIKIQVTEGQILWEWQHFKRKLKERSPERLGALRGIPKPRAHPLFDVVKGGIESWERIGG